MLYTIYAIHSKSLDIIYIGQTSNLDRRLEEHSKGYSKFTSRANDWRLFYSELKETRREALKRERQLKSSRGRAFLREKLNEIDETSAVRRETDQSAD